MLDCLTYILQFSKIVGCFNVGVKLANFEDNLVKSKVLWWNLREKLVFWLGFDCYFGLFATDYDL